MSFCAHIVAFDAAIVMAYSIFVREMEKYPDRLVFIQPAKTQQYIIMNSSERKEDAQTGRS